MQVDEALERENANWRICEAGIGAELVREEELARLRPHLEAFLAHGKLADIVFLRIALEAMEAAGSTFTLAPLVESILAIIETKRPSH
jgi:hypothetical protein